MTTLVSTHDVRDHLESRTELDQRRVLLVAAATSTTGGGERHVADLMQAMASGPLRLGLLSPAGGDLPALAASLGVPHHVAEIGGTFAPVGTRQVRAAVDAFRPDIVHAHGSRAAFYARRGDPRATERCIYTLHGIHIDEAGSPLRRAALLRVERGLVRRTARFVTVCRSDAVKGMALAILDSEKTTTVYNGITVPSALPRRGEFRTEIGLSADVPLALSIGRLHEQKDQATLLRAWARVRERVRGAVLALVGSGSLEPDLRSLARRLELGDSLKFLAPRRGLASAYVDADVFCLSSLWEGLPYVVLEAMSFGLPVVSTAVDGIPEAVAHGESGLLVPPRDVGALGDAIVSSLSDPIRAQAMGAAGRARVLREFTLDHMVDETLAVYRRLLGDSRRR